MSVVSRLFRGTAANAVGMGISTASQLLSVPVLSTAWGVDGYGTWLMLTTIPAYFALSDLGFATAATSAITMQVAKGARDEALRTIQSLFVLLILLSLAVIAMTAIAIAALPLGMYASWLTENSSVILLLTVYSALVMGSRVALVGFKATGYYARGTLSYDSLGFAETLCCLFAAWRGASFIQCVEVLLLSRALIVVALHLQLRRMVPWLRLGVAHASTQELRKLLKPALAATAIPTALALNLQGILLVVGTVISPQAAAMLAPVRTLSRVAIQFVGAINRATMPELSAATACGHASRTSKIVVLNIASVALFLVPSAIFLAVWGDSLVSLWTHNQIHPSATFIAIIASGMVLHGAWYFTANLLLAFNAHIEVARPIGIIAIATIFLAVPTAHFLGLIGVGVVLLLAEATCFYCVTRAAQHRGLFNLQELAQQFLILPSHIAGVVRIKRAKRASLNEI